MIHVGANGAASDDVTVVIDSTTATTLAVNASVVTSQTDATAAITSIDAAINTRMVHAVTWVLL